MNLPKSTVPSLSLCCKLGCWMCTKCGKVAAIGMKENVKCRNNCKVYAIRWCPPVL